MPVLLAMQLQDPVLMFPQYEYSHNQKANNVQTSER